VVVVVAVVAIITGVSVASVLLGGEPSAAPAPGSPAPASSSPTSTDSRSSSGSANTAPSGSASPSSSAAPDNDLDADDVRTLEEAIESASYSDVYGLLANPVHVAFAASDFDADRTPDQAITDLEYLEGSSGWNWDPDAATLTSFRDGRYGDRFPEGAIVGVSAEGFVVSLVARGSAISDVFLSKSTAALATPAQ
jgi:hypothetical protein